MSMYSNLECGAIIKPEFQNKYPHIDGMFDVSHILGFLF